MSSGEAERRLLVLYATETGNAQEIADRIARASRNLLFKSQVVSVDCYALVCLCHDVCFLLVELRKCERLGKPCRGRICNLSCVDNWVWC
jgi:hypothetical protein